jgi:two-component system C4-dicarboxylate transport response regulator DctD
MPDMDGFGLADRLTGYRQGMKILFMSGYTDTPQVAAQMAQPGRSYLQKPFTPDVLAGTVRKALDEK